MKEMNEKPLILVVEDERPLTQGLRIVLEHRGFRTAVAYNGRAGLNEAILKRPALIILDLLMPIMDGLKMLEALRNDAWGATVPVIIWSNSRDAETVQKARSFNVNQYVIKSDVGFQELADLVERTIKQLK